MGTKYFKKLNMANVISDRAGTPVEWEPLGDRDRTGVRSLDEADKADLIADLEKYAGDRVGGVVQISPEIYGELKKKGVIPQRSSPQLSGLRVAAAPDPFNGPVGRDAPSAAIAGSKPGFQEPPAPSASNFFARTRRGATQKSIE